MMHLRSGRFMLPYHSNAAPARGETAYVPGYQPGPPVNNAAQYQPPPSTAASSPFQHINSNIGDVTATLDSMGPLIDQIKPDNDFKISVANIFRLLVAQLKEIKLDQHRMREATEGSLRHVDGAIIDVTKVIIKAEQYNRRDTLTVIGVS